MNLANALSTRQRAIAAGAILIVISVGSRDAVARTPYIATSPCTPRVVPKWAPTPQYSVQARRLNLHGTVTLQLLIREDGVPAEVSVYASSGRDELDQSALATLRTWRYEPVMCEESGQPTQGRIRVPITFGR
ncbi:energy transducer TonB [Dyella sedimenti]|uniref:energy transducer TonB n=1 Tax=Dyella sedimenti TaxID=2919947 RepID=UPI003CE4C476